MCIATSQCALRCLNLLVVCRRHAQDARHAATEPNRSGMFSKSVMDIRNAQWSSSTTQDVRHLVCWCLRRPRRSSGAGAQRFPLAAVLMRLGEDEDSLDIVSVSLSTCCRSRSSWWCVSMETAGAGVAPAPPHVVGAPCGNLDEDDEVLLFINSTGGSIPTALLGEWSWWRRCWWRGRRRQAPSRLGPSEKATPR